MPTLPLYTPTNDPDAWHRVIAPGGYERWYFDAESADGRVRLAASFCEGSFFHAGYLRRYRRYRRNPTRVAPPLPGEYPGVSFAVYENGRASERFVGQFPAGAFVASDRRPQVTIGPNLLRRDDDGSYRVKLEGTPSRPTWRGPRRREGSSLSAEVFFRPPTAYVPREWTCFSREMTGADHRWVIAAPLCEVEGMIRLGDGRRFEFHGRGYHDHHYGTGPLGLGVRRWMRGRILLPGHAVVFQTSEPARGMHADTGAAAEILVIDTAVENSEQLPPAQIVDQDQRRTLLGLVYPGVMTILSGRTIALARPRVVDASAHRLRVVYVARVAGTEGTAFCEIAYPQRFCSSAMGRLIE